VLTNSLTAVAAAIFNASPNTVPAGQLATTTLPQALIIPPGVGSLTFLASAPGEGPGIPWIFRGLAHSWFSAGQPSCLQPSPSTSASGGSGDITINLPGGTNYLVPLNQDWNGTDILRITQTSTPTAYTLYVYASTDWAQNRRDPGYAQGASALDANGRWLTTVYVSPGKYHVVLLNASEAMVVFPYLNVLAQE
jgi:hypothetical protein